jgi:hypothetical protein
LIAIRQTSVTAMNDEISIVRRTFAVLYQLAILLAILYQITECIVIIAYDLTIGAVIETIRPRPKLACCLCLHLVALYTILL